MKKLTKEQIEKIKNLFNEGKNVNQIAKEIDVHPNTILYHTSLEFRNKLRIYNRERYRKMNNKQKTEYFKKKREYQRNYQKNKYTNDEEFRKKTIERSKKYQREKKNG